MVLDQDGCIPRTPCWESLQRYKHLHHDADAKATLMTYVSIGLGVLLLVFIVLWLTKKPK